MSELEFLVLGLSHWQTLAVLVLLCAFVLYKAIRRTVVGGFFDPLNLALVLGYSVNYAVVLFLYMQGLISTYLLAVMMVYALILLGTFRWVSRRWAPRTINSLISGLTPHSLGMPTFKLACGLYLLISAYIVGSIGFGVFAETNRFDAGRGFGAFIRILDFLSPFIVSFGV